MMVGIVALVYPVIRRMRLEARMRGA
jgi:hypothetical protein